MLATSLSSLNISCSCTECTTFLRPYPKNPPLFSLPPGLDFSLPSILPRTPIFSRKRTPHPTPQATPRLRPTAPILEPSPSFLLTRPTPQKLTTSSSKLKISPRAALPSLELSPTWNPRGDYLKRATFASRSLWAHISSPIDEAKTPISAKTPGLALCSNAGCERKVVPGFGRAVCRGCEGELKGAVLGLVVVMEDEEKGEVASVRPVSSRNDSVMAPSLGFQTKEEVEAAGEEVVEPALFAVPSTPPNTQLLLRHSRNSLLNSMPQRTDESESRTAVEPALFALPDTSLDTKPYEEITPTASAITPTTQYAMNFPALPTSTSEGKAGSREGSKRNSREMKDRSFLTAEESTRFALRSSNGSVKWRIR